MKDDGLKVMTLKVLEEVEAYLYDIDSLNDSLAVKKSEYDEELKRLKERYQKDFDAIRVKIDEREKALKKLLSSKRSLIFDKGDFVHLKNGSVWYRIRSLVKRARGVTVLLLEELGYVDGIKIEKSVNWDEIEKWSDERLTAIGTERVTKEEFGYDLRG